MVCPKTWENPGRGIPTHRDARLRTVRRSGIFAVATRRGRRLDFSLKLELASHPQLMSAVRSAVEKFAEAAGFAEPECRSIILAVDEALTNIIRHAYGNAHDQKIAVTCRRNDSGVEFIIEDRGKPVDPAKIRGRALEDVRPGGLGTHLIAHCMDEVKYEALPEGNRTRLFRRFRKH